MNDSKSGKDELCRLVEVGVKKRWKTPCDQVTRRIRDELAVIETVGCAKIFVLSARLVAAIREGGGLVGPGRGASPGSAVCYALGITGVDPVKHGLLFERFLHRELKQPRPILIDVDLTGEEIGRRYLGERYVCRYEERTSNIAPQYVEIEGVGEIGLTRIVELDLVADTLRRIRLKGLAVPDLDGLSDDCRRCLSGLNELNYDDDLMLIGQRELGLDAAASDAFRKAVCKRLRDRAERFERRFSPERWKRIWDVADGLFPKAHCFGIARLYSQMAYLATHCPQQWTS